MRLHARLAVIGLAIAGCLAAGSAEAERCKYKRDGTGNCLSPAFYKCQRDWTRCNQRCKTGPDQVKCNDKCEIKYAAQCGD